MTHGNPTIELPVDHGDGELTVARDSAGGVVWRGVAGEGVMDLRVDVWHGEYVGDAAGWAVLPPGRYRVTWARADAAPRTLAALTVDERVSWEESFNGRPPGGDWLTDGCWECGVTGWGSTSGRSYLFREGAMHGQWQATFAGLGAREGRGAACGLMVRHYNASAHLRVEWRADLDPPVVRLVQQTPNETATGREEVIAQASLDFTADTLTAVWSFNGDRHVVNINDQQVISVTNGFMGGVDIVGLFVDPGVTVQSARLASSQWTAAVTVAHDDYVAEIRPGNIRGLRFPRSARPGQNMFWESGIQFGHIGGSEIKFTQGARLTTVARGEVATRVAWCGPMPRMVEQSRDVRGHAWGRASFFADRMVICDEVLTWVNRSVGPDLDVLSRLLVGPVRAAVGEDRRFHDWNVRPGEAMTFLTRQRTGAFPIAVVMPLRLGDSVCRLLTLIRLRSPDASVTAGSHFAWHCARRLTGSYDFRATPTVPGQAYVFEIVTTWDFTGDAARAEMNLLNLRDDWLAPMRVNATVGCAVCHAPTACVGEQPREADGFEGSFDRSTGMYVLEARENRCVASFDPGGISRRSVAVAVRGLTLEGSWRCLLNGSAMDRPRDVRIQRGCGGETWLQLQRSMIHPFILEVHGS